MRGDCEVVVEYIDGSEKCVVIDVEATKRAWSRGDIDVNTPFILHNGSLWVVRNDQVKSIWYENAKEIL